MHRVAMVAATRACAAPPPVTGRASRSTSRSTPRVSDAGRAVRAHRLRSLSSCATPRRSPVARASPSSAPASPSRADSGTTASSSAPWSDAEGDALRAHYAREGWLVVRAVADARLVADLQTAADALQAEASTLETSRRDRGVFFEVQSASGRKRESAVYPGALRKVTSPSKRHVAFRRLVDSEAVAAVARDCAASRGILSCAVDQINFKPPRVGTGFPWHQDASFLKPLARERFDAHGGVNVVVALDPSDVDNGGFAVLGGTHARGEARARSRTPTTPPARRTLWVSSTSPNASSRRSRPGDAVFFHPLLAHGSGPNESERRRGIATLWYVSRGTRENQGTIRIEHMYRRILQLTFRVRVDASRFDSSRFDSSRRTRPRVLLRHPRRVLVSFAHSATARPALTQPL